MTRGTTIYLYELFWILPSIAIPVGMLVALVVFTFGAGVHLPGDHGRVEPTAVMTTPPFDQPGTVQVGPGQYEVRMVSGIWSFAPNEIRVPAGSTVTFLAVSRDVLHGLFIPRANVNVMLIPGQVAHVTTRFDRPGEYPFFCHEYCGIAHHTMWGKVIVEPASKANRHDGDSPS
ncbi:MAG TPA: cytochrome c oxidase subunit II [Candidatus Methylomirabilis sp.]|nr:cytochrome c oxidase subunit II [Candidatus Methylomirabilis sp.]